MQIRSLAISRVAARLERLTSLSKHHGEICGLLGGHLKETHVAKATEVHPLTNLSLRPTSFAIDVEEFSRTRDKIFASGQVPLVLYHSHPNGKATPSYRDRQLPSLTDLPSLILAWKSEKLIFQCFGDSQGKLISVTQ